MEVFPLHARGVLKLVDHNRVNGCADFFIDKGGISFTDETVKKGIGIGKQETVVALVLDTHFFVNVSEQSQVVQIAQGEVA